MWNYPLETIFQDYRDSHQETLKKVRVHSDADRMLISSHYGIDTTNVRVIPHGIYDQYRILDKNEAKKHLEIQESNVILFFGLIRPYKGVKFLIEAFERLPSDLVNDTRLLIVGESWEYQETSDRVKISSRISNITFINRYVGDDEIPYFFSVADILAFPYTRASQSGVAHIGMAYGIPIVASRVGGLEEGLGKYKGTRFVEPENTIELTKTLEFTLLNGKNMIPLKNYGGNGSRTMDLFHRGRGSQTFEYHL